MNILVKYKVDLNQVTYFKLPLAHAIQYIKEIKMFKLLIELGADINAINHHRLALSQKNILLETLFDNNLEALKILFNNGVIVNLSDVKELFLIESNEIKQSTQDLFWQLYGQQQSILAGDLALKILNVNLMECTTYSVFPKGIRIKILNEVLKKSDIKATLRKK